MLGVLNKCTSASGVRMLRTSVTPQNTCGAPVSPLESYMTANVNSDGGSVNWSQRRFLRCLPPASISDAGNINARFIVNEIENQHRRLLQSLSCGNRIPSARKDNGKENYRKSVRAHQSYVYQMSQEEDTPKFVADMFKIIIENGTPNVRVKSRKDDALVKEWIGIQNELHIIKHDRIEEDKRRLQIAGQQALREMEASLRKGMNLEDLDEAIEGALCSELKDQ